MQFCQLCSFSRGLPSPGNKCIMPLLRNVLFIHVNFIQAIPNFEPKTHTLEFSNSITAEIFFRIKYLSRQSLHRNCWSNTCPIHGREQSG
jgi:hypothetical protein